MTRTDLVGTLASRSSDGIVAERVFKTGFHITIVKTPGGVFLDEAERAFYEIAADVWRSMRWP